MPQPAVIGRLAQQDSPAIAVRVDSWVRRGRDYLQLITMAMVDAADVAEARYPVRPGTQICAPLGAAPADPRGPTLGGTARVLRNLSRVTHRDASIVAWTSWAGGYCCAPATWTAAPLLP
jgi:hypothetical protein